MQSVRPAFKGTLPNHMKSFPRTIAAFAAVCFLTVAAFAADASGTWTFESQGRNGAVKNTLVLAMKDGKLTGKVTAPGRNGDTTTEISNAKVEGDMVSFSVERTFNGNTNVTKYSGKLEGDTITGKMEGGRGGGDWKATRAKM
jgi:hypothetical protein